MVDSDQSNPKVKLHYHIALYILKSPQIRCILLIYGTVCMEFE